MNKPSRVRGEPHQKPSGAAPTAAVREPAPVAAKGAARVPAKISVVTPTGGIDEFHSLKDDVVRTDSRGRLTLGSEASEKQYRVLVNAEGQILLDPVVVIPEREAWLFKNLQAATSVVRGIEQAKAGDLRDAGSFASYVDD